MQHSRLSPEFRAAIAELTTAYTLYLLDETHPREGMAGVTEATENVLRAIDAAHQRGRVEAEADALRRAA